MDKLQKLDGAIAKPIQSDFTTVIANVKSVREFIEFAMWCATPRQSRDSKTQKEFAAKIRVDEDTLTAWKRHPQFWPLVQKILAEWIKERVLDVVNALYEKASGEGKGKEVDMFLRLAGMGITNNNKK